MKIDAYKTDADMGKCARPTAAEHRMNALTISFDPARLDRDRVHAWLSCEAYWSIDLPRAVFDRAVDNSLVACAFVADEQVGFARVVTDRATYAWLCDVFVAPPMRGLRRWALRTRDAHALYRRFGFVELAEPQRSMERHNPDVYRSPGAQIPSQGELR